MMAARVAPRHFQLLASLFACPTPAYRGRLETCIATLGGEHVQVAEQVQRFADLLADLSDPELVELHTQTFVGDGDSGEALAAMLDELAQASPSAGRLYARIVLLPELEHHLARLEYDRNPFAYLARAACCLLIGAVAPAPPPEG